MLDPWIIDEIRRREDQRRREQDACQIELPLYEEHLEEATQNKDHHDEPKRGVVVIDL
jgi:hypothetical protein